MVTLRCDHISQCVILFRQPQRNSVVVPFDNLNAGGKGLRISCDAMENDKEENSETYQGSPGPRRYVSLKTGRFAMLATGRDTEQWENVVPEII